MTREEMIKTVKSKMCKDCGIYLGGGKCSDKCIVIEIIEALKQKPNLDKIRAEMNGLIHNKDNTMYVCGILDCLDIIDEYKEGQAFKMALK